MKHLATACLALLVACGGGSSDPVELTNEGYASLGTGDYASAAESFGKALKTMTPGTEGYRRAKMGQIEALIAVNCDQATTEFMAMAEGTELEASDYRAIGSKMTSAKEFSSAIAVLDAGVKAFPEDDKMLTFIQQVREDAENAGDSEALDALEGLGYIGDDG